MRLLLTGATGFLGSHLARIFVANGHEVVILKRSFSDCSRIADLLPRLECYNLDLVPLDEIFRQVSNISVVLHMATCYGRNGESSAEVFSANTIFPLHLLELAVATGVNTFINTDTSLHRFLNPYALSKWQFAEWGRLFAGKKLLKFVNLELEHFYGAGDDASKFSTHVIRSCVLNLPELKLTPGEQRRDFIHLEDVLSAYLVLLDVVCEQAEFYQHYGVGSGQSLTIRTFVETVHQLAKSTTFLDFGGMPYRENEIMDVCADLKALTALGWAPKVSLIEGLKKTIGAEREKGSNP